MLRMIEKPRSTFAERGLAGISRFLAAAARLADAVALWPFQVAEHRRTMNALAALDDHNLRDIGVTRGDLRDSTGLPLHADPGLFLAGRRIDGRGRR